MGLLDSLFQDQTFGGQGGGLLSLLGQSLAQQNQYKPSAGFADQASPLAIGGGYQMPRIGSASQFTPDPAALPQNAQPTQGQMPVAPSASPTFLPQPTAGIGDRLNAGLQNFAYAGGPLQAIAGGLTGLISGNRTDPAGMAQQNLAAKYQSYIAAGLTPQKAMLATLDPKAADALLPQIAPSYEAHNVGSTAGSFNKATGEFRPAYTDTKYEKLGPGDNLVAVGGPNAGAPAGGAKTVATGGPEKPPAGYDWIDDKDKAKGVQAIPGGPGTHLPSETAGRIAMMETAAAELPKARDVLMKDRTGTGTTIGNMAGSVANTGEYARANRTVTLAIEGALRAMTGAAAPEAEVKRYKDMFMPGALDSRETATQKLNQLDDFISNAKRLVTQGRGPAGNNAPGRASDPLGIR